MDHYNTDLDGIDFADDVIRAIEKDYGRSVVRIPKFKRKSAYSFYITLVFTDFCILEAEIKIVGDPLIPTLLIEGVYL